MTEIERIRKELNACTEYQAKGGGGSIRVGYLLNALNILTDLVEEQGNMMGRISTKLGELFPPD